MKTLSSLGIGLSLVFGCLLLAFVVELYYLLWWKKRIANRDIEDGYSSSARELFHLLCNKKRSSSSLGSTELDDHHTPESDAPDHHVSSDDMLMKSFGEETCLETEIMRLQNFSGPPRLLFTIKEETKEDLESDDGRSMLGADDNMSRKGSSRGRSLSDLLVAVETTPYMTPLSSPPFVTPPSTPLAYHHQHGFNPLFESSTDAEMNQIKASPPPKFKFLKDAEEKLYRKTLVERAMKNNAGGAVGDCGSISSKHSDEEDGSLITIIVGKSKEKVQQRHHLHHHQIQQQQHQHNHSSSSQVLPLPSSSPSDIRPGC